VGGWVGDVYVEVLDRLW